MTQTTTLTGEERRAAKAERFRNRADKQAQIATSKREAAKSMADMIPFGQPILVGHHSESRSRRDRARITNNLKKGFEAAQKADYLRSKANGIENNNAIMSQDSDAVEMLQKKLDKLESAHVIMKQVNKIVRIKNLSDDDRLKKIIAETGLTEETAKRLLEPDFMGRVGFASYSLTNSSARIRSTKKRLEALKKQKAAGSTEKTEKGVKIVENAELSRIQLIFPGKPEPEVRAILKKNGFRWSPRNSAWQRHLNNSGLYAASSVISSI